MNLALSKDLWHSFGVYPIEIAQSKGGLQANEAERRRQVNQTEIKNMPDELSDPQGEQDSCRYAFSD